MRCFGCQGLRWFRRPNPRTGRTASRPCSECLGTGTPIPHTPDEPRCPYCTGPQRVRIKAVAEHGVAFVCPVHGHCGLRCDSMTANDRRRLGLSHGGAT